MTRGPQPNVPAKFQQGRVLLEDQVDWPEGTELVVCTVGDKLPGGGEPAGPVVVAGFGLAGRCVADLLDQAGVACIIVEQNARTVRTQRKLGRQVVEGDVADESTLVETRLSAAAALVLTIPDEEAVFRAITIARRLNPNLYIIARTNYSSSGMRATQLGADEVVKAEQAVALQFHDRLRRRLAAMRPLDDQHG